MNPKRVIGGVLAAAGAILFLAGCQTESKSTKSETPTKGPVTVVKAPEALTPAVHIKAGPGETFKDADGNTWIPEQGFEGGDTTERPTLTITGTKTPVIYLSEKYNMSSFSYPVKNGKYTVKLHFCETYEGITGPDERVFSFNVEGTDFKDFDIWVKTGGFCRACVITVPVTVTDGKVDVKFTPKVEFPQICGIEILPGN